MEQSIITTVLLPVALGVIMLGLGLSLTVADFKRIAVYPRPVAIGLVCQMLILPAVCLGIAHVFSLSPALAVGMMLLAASPGGATANLFSHLAKGDVALNITLTAVNSVLSLVTLPIIINYSLVHFFGEGRSIPLQFTKILQVVALVLVPVTIGMLVRWRRPAIAERCDKPVRKLSALFLAAVVLTTIFKERGNVGDFIQQVGLAALAFNLASMTIGYVVPRILAVERRQAIAIGLEIGIHNGTLAIAIASSPSLLNSPTMAVPAAVYSVIMFVTASVFGFYVARR